MWLKQLNSNLYYGFLILNFYAGGKNDFLNNLLRRSE